MELDGTQLVVLKSAKKKSTGMSLSKKSWPGNSGTNLNTLLKKRAGPDMQNLNKVKIAVHIKVPSSVTSGQCLSLRHSSSSFWRHCQQAADTESPVTTSCRHSNGKKHQWILGFVHRSKSISIPSYIKKYQHLCLVLLPLPNITRLNKTSTLSVIKYW